MPAFNYGPWVQLRSAWYDLLTVLCIPCEEMATDFNTDMFRELAEELQEETDLAEIHGRITEALSEAVQPLRDLAKTSGALVKLVENPQIDFNTAALAHYVGCVRGALYDAMRALEWMPCDEWCDDELSFTACAIADLGTKTGAMARGIQTIAAAFDLAAVQKAATACLRALLAVLQVTAPQGVLVAQLQSDLMPPPQRRQHKTPRTTPPARHPHAVKKGATK